MVKNKNPTKESLSYKQYHMMELLKNNKSKPHALYTAKSIFSSHHLHQRITSQFNIYNECITNRTVCKCSYLLSYSKFDTILMNVFGLILLFSRSSYRFNRNFSLWALK